MIENEFKTPYGCLTFIFYQKYFYDKMDLRVSYFHVTTSGSMDPFFKLTAAEVLCQKLLKLQISVAPYKLLILANQNQQVCSNNYKNNWHLTKYDIQYVILISEERLFFICWLQLEAVFVSNNLNSLSLTNSRQLFHSYRNQPIDLRCKSIN